MLHVIMSIRKERQHIMTAKALSDESTAQLRRSLILLFLLPVSLILRMSRLVNSRVIDSLHRLLLDSPELNQNFLPAQTATAQAIKERIFVTALSSGNVALIRLILAIDTGIDPNGVIDTEQEEVRLPLRITGEIVDCRKSLDAVNLLINAGADASLFASSGMSPVIPALDNGHMAVARKLIEGGSRACRHSLEFATNMRSVEAARIVLNASANVNFTRCLDWDSGHLPILLAAEKGQVEMVRLLIRSGADINVSWDVLLERSGRTSISAPGSYWSGGTIRTTALGVAMVRGHWELVQLLLAQPNIDINQYVCPLLIACDQGYDNIAEQLLNLGADIPIADESGRTLGSGSTSLLTAMVRRGGEINRALCEVFVSKGARLDHALLEAVRRKDHQTAKFLLSRGAPLGAS